jgi:glycosyltransferase involved in cell wall biosynthesis
MKVSIITVVKNDVANIEETLKSCISQSGIEKEYIVVDGLSEDGTCEVINKYIHSISLYVSESDKGIYDAMNKGAKYATGDWIIFINSGDVFSGDNSLALLDLNSKQSYSVIAGAWAERGAEHKVYQVRNSIRYSMPTSHQALLIKTELVKKFYFDIRYRVGADYDLVCKILKGEEQKLFASNHLLALVNPNGFGRNVKIYLNDYHRIIFIQFGLYPYLKYRLNTKLSKYMVPWKQ